MGSEVRSEIEKAERHQLETDIANGLVIDKKRLASKLLVQEVEFFMGKRAEVEAGLRKLEVEKDNLEKQGSGGSEADRLRIEMNGLRLSVSFFNRQIGVALHDLRVRNEKREMRCRLFAPTELTSEEWQVFLRSEGLEALGRKKLNSG